MNDTNRTSTLAVISLVAGILGWTLLPFLGSLGAIITGHMARSEIRRAAGTVDGNGLAIAGLVLGWGSVVVTVIGILLAVLFFGGIAALLAWLGLSGQLG
ncbi:DUF4190 domain-containing protein [Lysobacter hankyongensis]|uniref:DUF4190 domain-containing protein n=1 Tax=Lysobacter hankyongensis TaxID=1176535 RepID=A0ABP9BSA7_9GAMM